MTSENDTAPGAIDLVEHVDFLRRLARGLLGDGDRADDLAQDVAVAALAAGPCGVRRPRAWLRGVAQNLAGKTRRAERRRLRREEAVARRETGASAVDTAVRLETTRRLVGFVMDLPEPYRRTVVRRFFDDRSAAAIARDEGVPTATVRSRLSRALSMLRTRMDAAQGGDRRAWCAALLPFAATTGRTSGAAAATLTAGGALLSLKTLVLAAAAAVLLAVGFTVANAPSAPAAEPASPPSSGRGASVLRADAAAPAVDEEPVPVTDLPTVDLDGKDGADVLADQAPAPPAKRAAEKLEDRLAELDRRAEELSAEISRREGRLVRVAAVLDRTRAKPLGGERAYNVATFSFEKGTRDDRDEVRNDWDFELAGGGRRGLAIHVRTVVDDRGLFRDLGEIDLEAARRGDVPEGEGTAEKMPVRKGHVYLIHTLDSESDHWALMKVLELTTGESFVFRWEMLEVTEPLRRVLYPPERDLAEPLARLQLRVGQRSGNPKQVFLDGTTCAYVRRQVFEPFALAAPLEERERSRAFARGGLVPAGRVFLVERIEYALQVEVEDSHLGFRLHVGPFVLAGLGRFWEDRTFRFRTVDGGSEILGTGSYATRRVLDVRIPIRRDEEKHVFLELAAPGGAEVTITGRFLPDDGRDALPWPADAYRAERSLEYLMDASDPTRAYESFAKLGPEARPWLEAVLGFGARGAWRARLEAAIAHLGR